MPGSAKPMSMQPLDVAGLSMTWQSHTSLFCLTMVFVLWLSLCQLYKFTRGQRSLCMLPLPGWPAIFWW
jgi:hypothetical protein